jgi:RimJ/RimL family protein N-acetyltransferase
VVDVPELRTDRLLMRGWRDEDREPFAALNADLEVMRWFPSVLTRVESDAFVDRMIAAWADGELGLWAVEPTVEEPRRCVGFVGFAVPRFEAHFAPCIEIGWRLERAVWGRGYAPEAARAALAYGFDVAQLDEVVSMTTVENAKSRRVMEKLGMTYDPADDFDHPRIEPGHPIERHVLYRLRRDGYQKS